MRPGPAPRPPLALLVSVGDPAMLAYAFLVVAAVTEHARHPPPLGLIPLTCNEVQHLFAACSPSPPAIATSGCAGRCGDDDIKHAPAPATTDDRQPGTYERVLGLA